MVTLTGIIVGGVALVAALWFVSVYNSFVRLKNNIKKSWSNIDVLLKQRHDELTKLLDTVKGAMKFEKSLLTELTEARTAFAKAVSVGEKAQASDKMSHVLQGIFAVAENYPQVQANKNFTELQSRISGIEDQIADRREFYNDSVNIYNIRLQQFPSTLVGKILSYAPEELFKVSEAERQDVKIEF